MAEIRINATGGVKLYDADDSHYAQIIAGTITSNVDALTLGHASADFNIPVKVLGTTPTLTIGDAGAEDTKIVFDGNAQDFYIALDDSADDLLIGKGSTVGTTPAIAIDENLKVNIPVTTASTSASTGSLTTGGGAGIGADLYVGDDVYLITDSAVLGFGADKDTLLTHTDGTGLTLNSTNKLCFNDTSQFIQGISATVLGLGATDEIDLTATTVDLNGTLNVSGVATFQATPVFPDGSLALADLDIDGGTEIGAAIVDADLFIIDDGAGGTNRKCLASRIKTYAGGSNTPAWRVSGAATSCANATATKLTINTETFDTDSKVTSDAVTPGAGTYQVNIAIHAADNTDTDVFQIRLNKNGSFYQSSQMIIRESNDVTLALIIVSDADDYWEVFCQQQTGSTININISEFSGFKLIGV
jgi:hypothetical protein